MSPQGAPPPPNRPPAPTAENSVQIARLAALASSPRDEDQQELTRLLRETTTLDLLDTPDVRDRSRPGDLRIAEIIARLSANPAASAARSLTALTRNTSFNTSWQRQELLVRALAGQRPLLPDSLAFLDTQSQSESVTLHATIEALCANGSESALTLLARKLADPSIDSVYKIGWMRDSILLLRRDADLLRAAEKWLAPGKLDRELRDALAEALFDYQPTTWYAGAEGLPRPPAESATKPEASAVLRRIGQMILASDFPDTTKTSVRKILPASAP